jgi:hypothetical protein
MRNVPPGIQIIFGDAVCCGSRSIEATSLSVTVQPEKNCAERLPSAAKAKAALKVNGSLRNRMLDLIQIKNERRHRIAIMKWSHHARYDPAKERSTLL